jgi:hypothetical protein
MIDRVVFCLFVGYTFAMVCGCGGTPEYVPAPAMSTLANSQRGELPPPVFSPVSGSSFTGTLGNVNARCLWLNGGIVVNDVYVQAINGDVPRADVLVSQSAASISARCVDPTGAADDSPVVDASYEFR